jgi:uncharacterized protein
MMLQRSPLFVNCVQCAMAGFLLSACGVAAPVGRYVGTARIGGDSHDIAFTLRRDATGIAMTADLPFAWRMDAPVGNVVWDGGELVFTLPESIGTGRLSGDADRFEGALTLTDGSTAPVTLTADTQGAIVEQRLTLASTADGTAIATSVYLPAGEGPFPAAVVLHGGGNSDRANAGYRFYGQWLARSGVATAVYDKRGNGESQGNWRTVGFEARAGDVAAIVEHLRTLDDVDPDRVGLVAVSQGSWIADIVAARDRRLNYVVHVVGPVVPVHQADEYAMERSLAARSAPSDAIDGHRTLWQAEVAAVTDRAGAHERMAQAFARARRTSWFEKFPYEVSDPSGWWWTWYGMVANFDPRPLLPTIEARSLWIYGDRDTESDVTQNVAVIQALLDAGRPVALGIIPRVAHGLMTPVDQFGRSSRFVTAPPEFFSMVLGWIRDVARDAGSGR